MATHFNGIIDSTLREGEQPPGVLFSDVMKLETVRALAKVGIEEIELGVATPRSPGLISLVTEAQRLLNGNTKTSLWCRCLEEDIRFTARCRPDILSLSIPVSDIHLREKLRRNREWALERLKESIETALKLGLPAVSVGFEDATRADQDFIILAARTAVRAGAKRIRLADTVGIASPGTVSAMIKNISAAVAVPLGFHAHNDFGMATGNAMAALEAGAQWVDATVLGLGERAGNCRLEEIVAYLKLRNDAGRYKPEELLNLCILVADAARESISNRHPVVGEAIFTCETGLHVQGLTSNPEIYEPYPPARIGRHHTLQFGSKTGKRAVGDRLASLGIIMAESDVENLVDEIRQQAAQTSCPLDDVSLLQLAGRRIRQSQAGQDDIFLSCNRSGAG